MLEKILWVLLAICIGMLSFFGGYDYGYEWGERDQYIYRTGRWLDDCLDSHVHVEGRGVVKCKIVGK